MTLTISIRAVFAIKMRRARAASPSCIAIRFLVCLMAALQARDVAFETMLYPGLRHRAGWGPAQMRHRTEVTLDFFNRKLKPTAAP